MPENLQLSLFEKEESPKKSPCYRGGSHANRIALQESVKRLVTNVTYGRSTGDSLAKLSQDGLWLKMYGDCFQAKLDGSFEEYSETLPTWGLMSDGVLIQPVGLELYIDESEFFLLPTPNASMWRGAAKTRYKGSKNYHASHTPEALRSGIDDYQYINPNFVELLMGFPIKWTDLNA